MKIIDKNMILRLLIQDNETADKKLNNFIKRESEI